MRATRGRKYPEVNIGDKVRVLKKKKLGDKDFRDQLRAGENTIENIETMFGQKYYKLNDGREYMRTDFVKM